MEYDGEIIERLFADIAKKRRILENYRDMTREEFDSDPGRIMAVEHGFQTMIQAAIDIGLHLLTCMGVNGIETYSDVFDLLGKEGVLDCEFASKIRGMAGFRNILVHGYTKVDEELVRYYLKEHLVDFSEFETLIRKYLESAK